MLSSVSGETAHGLISGRQGMVIAVLERVRMVVRRVDGAGTLLPKENLIHVPDHGRRRCCGKQKNDQRHAQ